jgi:cell fate regulator YaaT (PSP1 superfamily)
MHNQTNNTGNDNKSDNSDNNNSQESSDTAQNVKTENLNSSNHKSKESDYDGHGSKWKDGDEIQFIRVRFPGNSKSFPFLYGKRKFQYGQKVVAMSDRGMTVGYINSFPYLTKFKKNMLPIKSIVRGASSEDIKEQKSHFDREKRTEVLSNKYITELKLEMNITHVEIIQFGKKAVIYFTAPARVDFRTLVKKLVGDLKMRIELRQISVRDRSAAIGAIGACGLLTCCSGFLKNYGHVSIKLAKLQNLALIPSKINGVCGQLKCCISYEENVYAEKRNKLPTEGKYFQLKNGDKGKITKTHILIEQFEMLTDQGRFRRYTLSEYDKNISLPKDWKFPDRFDHIMNETSKIIGLVEKAQETIPEENTLVYEFKNIPDTNLEMGTEAEKQNVTARPANRPNSNENSVSKNKKRNKNRNRNRNRKKNNSQKNDENSKSNNQITSKKKNKDS